MKPLIIFLVTTLLFFYPLFSLPQQNPSPQQQEKKDEIQKLKQEIRELKKQMLQLLQGLDEEQKQKFQALIKKLETQLSKKKAEKYSDTTREINRLKQKIESVKESLKELTGGIEFSGFFDVTASSYKNNPNIYALGDFELDMEKTMGENFQVAAALVFNDEGAELAAGFIDFHLFGGPIAARGRLFVEKGLHFQVGRFDVPFGNDWQYFASADRISVSPPLTTDLVMDGGYNDVGFRFLRAAIPYNFTLFMLRGIEEGFSIGGRFGLTPFNNPFTLKKKQIQLFDFGVSYMYDLDRDGKREEKLFALDCESATGPFHFQGEYIRRDYDLEALRLEGYHISLFIDSESLTKFPITLYSRYDFFQQKFLETSEKNKLSRLTLGLNINLFDISTLKMEYLHYLKENPEQPEEGGNSFYVQLVITF